MPGMLSSSTFAKVESLASGHYNTGLCYCHLQRYWWKLGESFHG